jgi:hypothetical protein
LPEGHENSLLGFSLIPSSIVVDPQLQLQSTGPVWLGAMVGCGAAVFILTLAAVSPLVSRGFWRPGLRRYSNAVA